MPNPSWPPPLARLRIHLLIALGLSGCKAADEPPLDRAAQLDQVMTDAVAKREMPGAALVVIDSGRVVISRGYGYADLTRRQPITDSSRFAVGSTSKPLTAIAALELVARGRLALDTPIVRYVPDLAFADRRGTAITMRHLLTNRSGMVVGFSGPAFQSPPIQDSAALGRLAHAAAAMPLLFAPGAGYAYSNRGFAVAGYVVERLAGMPIEDFMDREIFAPAGMGRTTLRFWEVPDLVQGYAEGRKVANIPRPPSQSREYGPSGMVVSTPGDVGRLLQILVDGGSLPEGGELLPKALVDEMFRPQADAESELGGPTKYGLGWETGTLEGLASVQKGGSVLAMATLWYLVPARRLGIALFMTRVDYGLVPALANLLAVIQGQAPSREIPARAPPPEPMVATGSISRSGLQKWVGVYDTRSGETRVFLRGDSLRTDHQGLESGLAAIDDSSFALVDDLVEHTGRALVFRRRGGRRTIWFGADSIGVELER